MFQWIVDASFPVILVHIVLALLGFFALWRERSTDRALWSLKVIAILMLGAPLLLFAIPQRQHQVAPVVTASLESPPSVLAPTATPASAETAAALAGSPLSSIHWLSILLIIWICGIVAFGLKLSYDLIRLSVYLKRLPQPSAHQVERLKQILPGSKGVQFLVDREASTPYSFRGRFAYLVLPERCVEEEIPERLSCIVIHEWAHLRHLDSWEELLWRIVRVCYWWNPLLHRLANRVSELQEWRSDREATGSDPQRALQLSRALLDYSISTPPIALAQSMANSPREKLKSRIERLLQTDSVLPKRSFRPALLALVASASLVGFADLMPAGEKTSSTEGNSASAGEIITLDMVFIETTIRTSDAKSLETQTRILSPLEHDELIKKAARDRKATTVSYPSTTTKSGRTSELRSVINEPVTVMKGDDPKNMEQTIEYLPIGTIAKITPTLLKSGQIHCDTNVTISDIVGREIINGVEFPVVSSRIYSAPLEVTPGYTICIEGLDEATVTKKKTRKLSILVTPVLGQRDGEHSTK